MLIIDFLDGISSSSFSSVNRSRFLCFPFVLDIVVQKNLALLRDIQGQTH